MSRPQLGLAAVLFLLTLLGLPAYILPTTTPATSSSGSSSSKGTASVPETSLSLTKTTEEQREEIRYRRKVNINTADKAQLETIPSIGPNMAEDILKFRKNGNTFYRVSDLDQVSGFGTKTVETIKDHVTVGRDVRKEAPPSGAQGDKIDINSASKQRLKTLQGVGSVTADRIITYREENDGIRTTQDLNEIPGIGSATIERLLPQLENLSREKSGATGGKINVNFAGEDRLTELPGIGPVTAGRIIEYRNQNGDFASLDDLMKVSGIGDDTVEGLRDSARVE